MQGSASGVPRPRPAGPPDAWLKPSRPQVRRSLGWWISRSDLGLHPGLTSVPTTSWPCASREVGNLSVTLIGVLLQVSEAAWEPRLCHAGPLRSAQPGPAKAPGSRSSLTGGPWSCPREVISTSLITVPEGKFPQGKSALKPTARMLPSATALRGLSQMSPHRGACVKHRSQRLTPRPDLVGTGWSQGLCILKTQGMLRSDHY